MFVTIVLTVLQEILSGIISTYTQDEVLKLQNEQLAYQENIKMLAK